MNRSRLDEITIWNMQTDLDPARTFSFRIPSMYKLVSFVISSILSQGLSSFSLQKNYFSLIKQHKICEREENKHLLSTYYKCDGSWHSFQSMESTVLHNYLFLSSFLPSPLCTSGVLFTVAHLSEQMANPETTASTWES